MLNTACTLLYVLQVTLCLYIFKRRVQNSFQEEFFFIVESMSQMVLFMESKCTWICAGKLANDHSAFSTTTLNTEATKVYSYRKTLLIFTYN